MADGNGSPTRPRCLYRATRMLFLVSSTIAFLQGCTVDDISVVSYTSSAEVKPEQAQSRQVVGSSPFPWDIVLRGVSDIFTGARKKAIEENVGYRESRSFTLFRLKKADSRSQSSDDRHDQPPEDSTEKQAR